MSAKSNYFRTSLCILLFISGCSEPVIDSVQKSATQRPVKVITIESGHGSKIRSFPAVAKASESSNLAFLVSGKLTEKLVNTGDEVTEGQVLLKLELKELEITLKEQEAKLKLSSAQLARAKKLLLDGLVSESEYEKLKAGNTINEAAVARVTRDIDNSELRAPFSGIISNLLVQNYENIQAQQPVATLVSKEQVDLVIHMSPEIFTQIPENSNYQPIAIFDAFPNEQYLLTLKEWEAQASKSTGTHKIVFSMKKPNGVNILPGMNASVLVDLAKLNSNSTSRISVPTSAVFSGQSEGEVSTRSFVWKVETNTMTVHKTEVKTGKIHGNRIQILSGINSGDVIVTAGVHSLSANQRVSLWHREKGL